MTYQSPPPPPPPPPPGGGQPYGAQPGAGFDPKAVDPKDWGILAAGLLAFIFSFISYYSYSGGGASVSDSAWHGFFGWFAMLLAVVGSAVVALILFMPQVKLPVPARLTSLACYAVATLCVILALFIVPSSVCIDGYCGSVPSSVDKGHGAGYWISLIVVIVGLVLTLMQFQAGGGKLPGALGNLPNIGGGQHPGGHQAGGQPGYGAQQQPPPAPGYAPPPPPPPAYEPPPPPPPSGP